MSATPSSAPRRLRRTAVRLGSAVAAAVLLTGCSFREAYESSLAFGFPKPVTDEGKVIYDLWLGSTAAAAVVGLFVWALIAIAVVAYRKTTDTLPRQVRYNLPIEVLYTFIPFVIVSVLFYYTVVAQNRVNALSDDGPDVTVEVVGFQWNWTFRQHTGGLDTPVTAEVTGEPLNRAVLVVPTNRKIQFVESSPDVIHSFFVPDFLFKRDVLPVGEEEGVEKAVDNPLTRRNVFELTIRKEGTFIGRCAEFCGEKHSRMNFYVKAVSPEAYDSYLAEKSANPAARVVAETPVQESSSAGSAS